MHYIGIDPGASGGIAVLTVTGEVVFVERTPTTELDVLTVLTAHATPGTMAALERVHAMPRQGVSSTFKFGAHYGMLRMALVAARIRFDEVAPMKWQRALGCLSRGDKNVTKRRAQELFPDARVTHAVADALLLAEYRRRHDLGQL